MYQDRRSFLTAGETDAEGRPGYLVIAPVSTFDKGLDLGAFQVGHHKLGAWLKLASAPTVVCGNRAYIGRVQSSRGAR